MMRRRNHTRKGFNLIEAAIVLAVVGLVIGVIWRAAATVTENRKVSEMVQGAFFIVRNVQKTISISDSIAIGGGVGISTQMIAAEGYPSNWVNGTTVKNPFGGSAGIKNYTNPSRFDFSMNTVPQSACIKLLVGITQTKQGYYDNGNRLGYVQVKDTGGVFRLATSTFPITPTQATSACVEKKDNRIWLTFGYTRTN